MNLRETKLKNLRVTYLDYASFFSHRFQDLNFKNLIGYTTNQQTIVIFYKTNRDKIINYFRESGKAIVGVESSQPGSTFFLNRNQYRLSIFLFCFFEIFPDTWLNCPHPPGTATEPGRWRWAARWWAADGRVREPVAHDQRRRFRARRWVRAWRRFRARGWVRAWRRFRARRWVRAWRRIRARRWVRPLSCSARRHPIPLQNFLRPRWCTGQMHTSNWIYHAISYENNPDHKKSARR